ncbi:hypothetical protein DM860_015797 [Cuscuta australis]|uniref:Uncharacterized protein n=1 Tax=Cuscuta australis TaxID=267555 RepID=A0A328DZK9_9ASTE|nr:hypothetical protein DM860_015797 [Cuscuta australis]
MPCTWKEKCGGMTTWKEKCGGMIMECHDLGGEKRTERRGTAGGDGAARNLGPSAARQQSIFRVRSLISGCAIPFSRSLDCSIFQFHPFCTMETGKKRPLGSGSR